MAIVVGSVLGLEKWLGARLGSEQLASLKRAEPDFLARKNSEPSRLVQAREPARELDPIQFKNNFTMIDELILHH